VASKRTAADGDTLCNFAIDAGFFNCQALRADPANSAFLTRALKKGDEVTIPDLRPRTENCSTDKLTKFLRKNTPPVSIRFVHGSPNKHYLADTTLDFLQVSNHITSQGGAKDDVPFPDKFEFQKPGHDDPDTFKVEVVDSSAGATLDATLEALKQIRQPDGTITHDVFPGAEAAKRKLDPVSCKKVRSKVAYRSKYLRLVVDEADKAAKNDQTLLTTDMTDQGDPAVEILEQNVRASYALSRCPGSPKCRISVPVPIGSDTDTRKPRRRIRIAVHVLRATPHGTPVVTPADANRRVTKWIRRLYAQASIAPKLVQAAREVDPVANLVAVSDPAGTSAAGDGQLGFRLTAPGKPALVVGPVTPAAGDTPQTSANALAALVTAPYSATVTVNPARFTDPPASRSADLLITPPDVTIDNLVSTDSRQALAVGRPNPLNLQSWDGTNFLVGSLEQRTLLKNYDTGQDRIDIIVVQQVTAGNRGEAMMSGHQIDPLRPAIAPVRFSAFLVKVAMDGSDQNPFSAPHECGHVTMELVHAQGRRAELMSAGTSGTSVVGGTKRIKEGLQAFDSPAGSFLQLKRLLSEGAPLLEPF